MTGVGWALIFIGFLTLLVVADLAVGAFFAVRAWLRRRAYRRALLYPGRR